VALQQDGDHPLGEGGSFYRARGQFFVF
jgi:hypothetical protein